MFTEERIELAVRKANVQGRIEGERARIAAGAALFQKPLAGADKVAAGMRYVQAHPWVAGAAGVSLILLGRGRLLTWGLRSWTAWRTWKRVREWLRAEGYLQA